MVKLKATKKEMKEGNFKILRIGYCQAQSLLKSHDAIAYSCGAYGWSCDYYVVDDVLISTGYSPINSYNMKDDYKLINEYENKSNTLFNDYYRDYNETIKDNKLLLSELLSKLKV